MEKAARITGASLETANTDYILGTNSDELYRLEFQHGVWRETVLDCWRRAGIKAGARILDVGAGPGYATIDLATMAGPSGQVIALERSINFLAAARERIAASGFKNVEIHSLDLMQDLIPAQAMDFAWCRWVNSFVASPGTLVKKIHAALRPGGTAIFFEYVDYASWRLLPHEPMLNEFVTRVMASWRETGGEPDVAPAVVGALHASGFKITSARPHVFCARPGESFWQWLEMFTEVNTARSLEAGAVTRDWAGSFVARMDAARKSSNSLMITPMVLEIIARRE